MGFVLINIVYNIVADIEYEQYKLKTLEEYKTENNTERDKLLLGEIEETNTRIQELKQKLRDVVNETYI